MHIQVKLEYDSSTVVFSINPYDDLCSPQMKNLFNLHLHACSYCKIRVGLFVHVLLVLRYKDILDLYLFVTVPCLKVCVPIDFREMTFGSGMCHVKYKLNKHWSAWLEECSLASSDN